MRLFANQLSKIDNQWITFDRLTKWYLNPTIRSCARLFISLVELYTSPQPFIS